MPIIPSYPNDPVPAKIAFVSAPCTECAHLIFHKVVFSNHFLEYLKLVISHYENEALLTY